MSTHPFATKLGTLAPLSGTQMRLLAEAASRTVTVAADGDIVREGEPSAECRVLIEGLGARYKLLPEGERQIVAFGLPGDALNLEGFARGSGAVDHAVTALCPCTVAVIPHQALREIADEHPAIAQALWRDTLLDAAVYREWVVNVGRRSAQERIAHLLCEVFTRLDTVGLACGEDDEARSFGWPVTQAELGDATGLSTVHVNRTLQGLRREGLIVTRGGEITIPNWWRLQALAGFTANYLMDGRTPR